MTRRRNSLPWSAALLGTMPGATLLGVALARLAPAADEARLAIGLCAIVPLWVSGICLTVRCRSHRAAWLGCAIVCALAYLLAFSTVPAWCGAPNTHSFTAADTSTREPRAQRERITP